MRLRSHSSFTTSTNCGRRKDNSPGTGAGYIISRYLECIADATSILCLAERPIRGEDLLKELLPTELPEDSDLLDLPYKLSKVSSLMKSQPS
mmetsp:Transcript_12178/g.17309  ORF Transcript_12178/g.17309 Transcript_12178/m.17309 type:complete len:92 (+) Transcript_12178:2798-3073(+)